MAKFTIQIATEESTRQVTQEELLSALGISPEAKVFSMQLIMETERGSLTAHASDDGTYGNIDVDGQIDGKMYYCTDVELPVPDEDPEYAIHGLVSRVYCGNPDVEADAPCVLVPMLDRKNPEDIEEYFNTDRRIVYVDNEVAAAESMDCNLPLVHMCNCATEKEFWEASAEFRKEQAKYH